MISGHFHSLKGRFIVSAIKSTAIRLDELIREVVALYQQGDSSLNFDLSLVSGPDGLAADSGRLRQLLHNLIRNAQEAVDTGEATIMISTGEVDSGEARRLQLEIQDDGPGFPQRVLDQPFEPYVSNKVTGSGLGLALSRQIVESFGGRLELGERLDRQGAVATLRLPVANPD